MVKKKKIGIYSPYLDALGGGERYLFTLAKVLTSLGEAEVFWPNKKILTQAEKRLGLDLGKVRVNDQAVNQLTGPALTRISLTRQYDFFFWVSDGSLPLLFAKKNILHFQVPFRRSLSLRDRLKLARIDLVVVNSQFTRKVIDRTYQVKSEVVYPPVQVEAFRPQPKQKTIVVLGRFSKHFLAKKQDVLIKAFQKLVDQDVKDWRLKLVGGQLDPDQDYLDYLKKLAGGYPIDFLVNISFGKVVEILGQASILWHAAGFGEDPKLNPERMEHFGIAPVEAQASGCIPLVYAGGGLLETVEDGINGYRWRTEEELLTKTRLLITKGIDDQIKTRALIDCQRFNEKVFAQKVKEIFF